VGCYYRLLAIRRFQEAPSDRRSSQVDTVMNRTTSDANSSSVR
jgi:hypothetical protein